MNIRQLEYIVKISEEGSITKAANQLFITQSALDQQLLKLEKELGLQLFRRNRVDFSLTPAGEVYVSYAKKIINLKNEAYQIINDLANKQCGTLSIGLTPERGIEMFMAVYPLFYEMYPNITVIPREIRVKSQLEMIQSDTLDLGFVTISPAAQAGLKFYPILEEKFVLAIPRNHPYAAHANSAEASLATADLSLFENEAFVLMFKDSTQRSLIDPLFAKAGYEPHLILETASNQTLISMVEKGLSCSILPSYYVKNSNRIVCFSLPENPKWQLSACCKSGRYLSNAASSFIKLATAFWNGQTN